LPDIAPPGAGWRNRGKTPLRTKKYRLDYFPHAIDTAGQLTKEASDVQISLEYCRRTDIGSQEKENTHELSKAPQERTRNKPQQRQPSA
jgi:hypothetical protein